MFVAFKLTQSQQDFGIVLYWHLHLVAHYKTMLEKFMGDGICDYMV